MNQIADEIYGYIENGDVDALKHYGMPRRSGRYPYGSGEDPYQHDGGDFLSRIEKLKKNGWEETPENIKKEFGLTTTQYRTEKSNANDERKMYQRAQIESMRKDKVGWTEIGRRLGLPESTVRSMMDEKAKERTNKAKNTAEFLKKQVDAKGMVDVGNGVEIELGISKEKMKQAIKILEEDGYKVYKGGIPQATNPGKQINQMVLCKPGTEHKEIYDYDRVHPLNDYKSHDGGETFDKFVYPKSISSKRVKVLLKDEIGPDGEPGVAKDGIIQIRRGVEDLSLGDSRYSQVRILVDNKKYLKGMAVYSDNIPDGYDIVFNSNKTSVDKAYKAIKEDPDNPFGSLIKPGGQSYYIDKNGKRQLSAINKPREEGDWSEWSNGLPAQFLSKQSKSMAKKQLDIAKADKIAEFQEICELNNPTIKKHLLNKFADECDSAAVKLKAASLPGQRYHVIIPMNDLGENEIYAPNYKDGTKLALIRYPHGGTFEIPICTVNNKLAQGRKLIGTDAVDAVGINHSVAERLSGADFDGDTVMCIPTHDRSGRVKIASTKPLDGLIGFDPQEKYPERKGMKYMKDPVTGKDSTQMEMGIISNLITDMTLAGAKEDEMARAVRHSMVVIDAAKHKLDYKQSEVDNNIKALVKEYQRTVKEDGSIKIGGASTLISQASGEKSVLKRQGNARVNLKDSPDYDPSRPEGALIWKTADDAYWDKKVVNKKTGEVTIKKQPRTQKSTRMNETDDAMTLVSEARHPMELIYADYANSMKELGRRARIESAKTGKIAYSKEAKVEYSDEVRSLNSKLGDALVNKPREREAQRRTKRDVDKKIASNPNAKKEDIRKWNSQALNKHRSDLGSVARRDRSIAITDREWEAIQKGAVSESTLIKILDNTDIGDLRSRATPRRTSSLSPSQITRINAMRATYTISEIADKLNISPSTVSKYLKGGN